MALGAAITLATQGLKEAAKPDEWRDRIKETSESAVSPTIGKYVDGVYEEKASGAMSRYAADTAGFEGKLASGLDDLGLNMLFSCIP